jgi:formylglycine-generating enzyme required for sulfatase activity
MEITVNVDGQTMVQISQMKLKVPCKWFDCADMAGNVAEWVQDVYRPIIDNEAEWF